MSARDNRTFSHGRRSFDKLFIPGEIYGGKVYGHPSFDKEDRKLYLLIRSLVESGDLNEDGEQIFVSGKALETISKYEIEERRHRDNKIHNLLIFLLTAVLAIASVAQLFIAD